MATNIPWYSTNYPYRRPLSITGPVGGALTGHNVIFSIPVATTITQGKVRQDLQDLLMLYIDPTLSSPQWVPIPSASAIVGLNIEIQFALQAPLSFNQVSDTNYYLYYGNPNLIGAPVVAPYVLSAWAFSVAWDGIGVGYTRPGEHWLSGVSKAFGAKLTFQFYGTDIQLVGNKLPNAGIASIQVDSLPPTTIDYFSFKAENNTPLFTQNDLNIDDLHVLRMIATGQKNPSSSSSAINVVNINYNKTITAVDLGEQVNSTFWSSV